jgi:hypothetical protein
MTSETDSFNDEVQRGVLTDQEASAVFSVQDATNQIIQMAPHKSPRLSPTYLACEIALQAESRRTISS